MKHIQFITLCLSLLITIGLQAQLPQGRTTATVIADALAQLPADTPDKYDQTIADLVSTGEEGLLDLIGRMNPPGNQNNETLEYAISGWTHFVANDDGARGIAAGAFEKALSQPLDKEVKAFLIRRLRTIATDENVEVLSAFLTDEYLSDPAAQALVSIGTGKTSGSSPGRMETGSVLVSPGTEKANNALLAALTATNAEGVRLNLINAIGQTGYQPAEPVLLGLLNGNSSEAMQKVILNALGKAGTKKSLKALRQATEDAGYTYQKENATASYISLLGRLNNTEPGLVKKEAENLLATGKKLDKQDIRIEAAKLLLSQPSVKKEDILADAIRDGNITYLSGVLNLYPFQDDKKSTELIQNELGSSTSPQVQTALTYWSGNHNRTGSIPQIAGLADSSNDMVQKAAILSLAKLGGEEALITLASLLESDNDNTVTLAKNALSTYNGDISYTLASVFEKSGDAGKKAILELISNRKMENQYNLVYNQMFIDNAALKSAAANTLKDVATDRNLSDLFTLLEREDAAYVPAIQQAINAALDYLPADEQSRLVTERMKGSSSKHLYYTALANSGSQEALNMITGAYASATGAEKEAAFDALTQWKSFLVIHPMLDIARNSDDSRELEKVTDALISLIRHSGQDGTVQFQYLHETMQFAQTDKQKNDILRLMGNTGQYRAMLFAAPYMDEPALKETAALAAMNIAINDPSFAGTETTDILNKVSKTLSNPDADYQRQSIAKYLTENSPSGTESFQLSTEEVKDGFRILFDGTNLDQWTGNKKDYVVENGQIVLHPSKGSGGNLYTNEQFANFVFRFEFMLTPGANNGLGIRTPLEGDAAYMGMELQILDNDAPVYEKLAIYQYHGSVYGVIPAKRGFLKPVGEWNYQEVIADGDHIKVILNGTTILDGNIREASKDGTLDKRDHPGLLNQTGHIGFLGHGSKVKFRNIRIKELK